MKSSHFYSADRPESGGADRKQEREKTGSKDIAKQALAKSEANLAKTGHDTSSTAAKRANAKGTSHGEIGANSK